MQGAQRSDHGLTTSLQGPVVGRFPVLRAPQHLAGVCGETQGSYTSGETQGSYTSGETQGSYTTAPDLLTAGWRSHFYLGQSVAQPNPYLSNADWTLSDPLTVGIADLGAG